MAGRELLVSGVLYFILGSIPYTVILAGVVRAQIILVPLMSIVFTILLMRKRVSGAILVSICLLPLIIWVWEYVINFIHLAVEKQQAVGLNTRDLEMLAVWENASSEMSKLLFGEGWGGVIQTPVYYNINVRFVHNSIGYFLFKTGIIGLMIVLAYYIWIIKGFNVMRKLSRGNPCILIAMLASLNAVTLNLILEPGFKMLTFGFIVSLVVISFYWSNSRIQTYSETIAK